MPPRDRNLAGQTALVTGASSGIGQGVAVELARRGADVAVNFHADAEGAEATARRVRDAGAAAEIFAADVSQPEAVERMFRAALDRFGALDILVGNAGIQQDAAFAEMTAAQWRRVIEVNLGGQFLCAQAAVRCFRRQGRRPGVSRAAGKIVFVSSVHDLIPWAGHVNYAASKGGLAMLMKSLAQEVAGERIRVNAVSPGAIRTAINRPAWETEEALRALLGKIPYGRIGEVEDVARAVAWLVGEDSDYVTGATLYVDGGMALYPEFREGG